jgi:drug/metabolite transporter (DMT)-like permease
MNPRRLRLLGLIFTVVLWGFSFISIKISVAVLPPMSLGAARFALSILLLWVIKQKTVPEERLQLRDLPYLAGAGLIGVTAYFFFENNGVSLVSASEASIIIATIPVLMMVAERIFSGGRIAKRRWAGAFLSMVGVWLVAGTAVVVTGSALGYLYMLGAAFSWVAYTFLTRPLFASRSRIYIVFWQSIFGFLGFLPFTIAEFPSWGSPSIIVILNVAFLGFFCSALGYWLYVLALGTLGIGTSTVFINLIPVVTVAAGFVILGERLAALQWLGAVVVLAGVYLATIETKPYHSIERAKPNT